MSDIDYACRRMAARRAAEAASAPVPRVRRGAQRSWEDAYTHNPQGRLVYPNYDIDYGQWLDARRIRSPSLESSTAGESELSDTNWQEAELSPPRYRKDLSRLGVPIPSIDAVSALSRQFSSSLALDGAVDASYHESPVQPHTSHLPYVHRLRQTPGIPRSPLHQTHRIGSPERSSTIGSDSTASNPILSRGTTHQKARAATFSNDYSVDDGHSSTQHRGKDRSISSETFTTAPYIFGTLPRRSFAPPRQRSDSENATPMRVQSSHDLSYPDTTYLNLATPAESSTPLLRPPITRLSSFSTPNLMSRVVSSDIMHSRNASVNVQPPAPGSWQLPLLTSSYMSISRACSAEPPLLEVLGGQISPLEQLEQDVSSEYSSAPSIASFQTTNTRETSAHIRFPSFGPLDSPEKQVIPRKPLPSSRNTPDAPSESSSIDNSEVLLAKAAQGYPSPVRIRSVALPPPPTSPSQRDPARIHVRRASTIHVHSRQPSSQHTETNASPSHIGQTPASASLSPYPLAATSDTSRFDSVLDLTSPGRASAASWSAVLPHPDSSRHVAHLDVADATSPPSGRRTPRQVSTHHGRTFPIFSPPIDIDNLNEYDYSRYPDPHMNPNRRSLPLPVPVSSASGLTRSETTHASRRPERPYSHGARPRAHHQAPQYPAPMHHHHGSASHSTHGFLNRPPAPHRTGVRTLPVWQRNQENDGSAEEELMRGELQGYETRMRGGAAAETVTGQGGGQHGGVLDDTPPREGRFERLMRS